MSRLFTDTFKPHLLLRILDCPDRMAFSYRRALVFANHTLRKLPRMSMRFIATVLVSLLLLVLILSQFVSRLPDESICETEEASKYAWLCGTTTRVCVDHSHDSLPRPLVVIAAGGSRASSTWLFNALRILMRIRDPNTVSGWHTDLQGMYESYARNMERGNNTKETASRIDAFRSLGSVLIKLHLVQDWHEFNGGGNADTQMAPYVDAVFTSHRDLRTVVRSVKDMGWGVLVPSHKLLHADVCKRRDLKHKPTYLRNGQYKKPSTWVNLAQANVKCRQALFQSAGDKLKMDLKAEDIRNMDQDAMSNVLQEMGKHLDYSYNRNEIDMAVRELMRLKAPKCDSGFDYEMDLNPVTHLHKGHVRMDKSVMAQAMDRKGMSAIEQDEDLANWLIQHGYDLSVA